jgi:D-3-phosphoglycerate dehydrogenase
MLNEETLGVCKPGIRIVNVARGPLIDEQALYEAQRRGVVAACALDVFELEPLPCDHPLREFPSNVFGSHNASNTVDAVKRTSLLAIDLLHGHLLDQAIGVQ